MKNITIVIPDHFADWEYSLIAPVLHSYTTNYRVRYAAADLGNKTSMGALRVIPDLTFADIPAENAALILIGGQDWRELNPADRATLAAHCERQKTDGNLLAAICDGAWFLAANGLLNDRRHTGNHLDAYRAEAAYHNAAQYQDSQREAVRDTNLITAGAMAAPAFSRAVLEALGDIPAEVLAYLPAA